MTATMIDSLLEDVKRPIRNIAHRLGIKRQSSNEELVMRHGPIVTYCGNLFDVSHPRCNALIGGSIIKRSYERMELKMINEHIRPDDRVIELGACMGVTSLVLFDKLGRDQHLVIEADRRNFILAEHMFKLNAKDVRMKYGILASGSTTEKKIAFRSNANASSSSQLDRDGSERVDQVPVLSFEEVLEKEHATALVLDIEGGEYELFTRATSFGSLTRILLEAHPDILGEAKMNEVLSALSKHGFCVISNRANARFLVLERSV